jgi:hypothetical protein
MPNIQLLPITLHLQSLVFFFFCINGYKSKFGGVLQECRGYGYADMMQMKKLVIDLFDGSLQPQNKTKLNAQHSICLGTCLLPDIFIIV